MSSCILGICINEDQKENLLQYPGLKRENWLDYLLEAKREHSLGPSPALFVFSIFDICFAGEKIYGYLYEAKTQNWVKKEYGFPRVIYKKGGYKKSEQNVYKNLLKYIQEKNIKLITPFVSFDKWILYRHLQEYSEIRSYMVKAFLYDPKSKSLSNDMLKEKIEKKGSLYLKDPTGRCGKNIIKVNKRKKGYESAFYRDGVKKIPAKNFEELISDVNKFFRGKSLVVEETINLLTLDDKLIDLRAELQRHRKGRIKISAISVRVGIKESPVTQHSESYPFNSFFNLLMGWSQNETEKLYHHLEYLTPKIYSAVEDYYGCCAEMGIDIGIEKNKKTRLIECNSHPTRVSLRNAYGKKKIIKIYKNLMDYAYYLMT